MLSAILKRPSIMIISMMFLLIAGVVSVSLLPVKLLPTIKEPYITINVLPQHEASIDELERQITLPLEKLARHTAIVKETRATTSSNQIRLSIEVSDRAKQRDIDQLITELETRITGLGHLISSSEVRQQTSHNITFMQIAIIPDNLENEQIRRDIIQRVIPELEQVPGIQAVSHILDRYDSRFTLQVKEPFVENIPAVQELINALQQTLSTPVIGRIAGSPLRTELALANQQELEGLILPSGTHVSDVVELQVHNEADNFFYEVDGRDYYRLFLHVTPSADEVGIAKEIREHMRKLHQGASWDYIYIVDTSEFIGQAMREVLTNILIGAFVAIGLLWLIFRSLKTMLVIAISIPVSVSMTLLTMNIFDYSLNIITLIGLGLGIGMIVDACIVILENIFKKIEEGLPRLQAVIEGTREVIAPVTTSILTTVVVFIPIAFIDGMVGAMGKQFSITVMVALFASLLVSITLIPLLSFYLVPSIQPSKLHHMLLGMYEKLLIYLLNRKWRFLLTFVMLLGGLIIVVVMFIPKSYIPDVSERAYSIRYNLSEQVSFDEHRELMQTTAEKIRHIEGVGHVFYTSQRSNPRRGNFYILYQPVNEMTVTEAEVNKQVQQLIHAMLPISTARFSTGESDTRGSIQLALTSNTMFSVRDNFQQILDALRDIEGITTVESTLTPSNHQEWLWQYNREALYATGMSREQIEEQLGLILNGMQLQMKLGDAQKQVTLQFPEHYRRDLQQLLEVNVHPAVPMTYGELVTAIQIPAEAQRVRLNGVYEIGLTVYYNVEAEKQVINALEQLMSKYDESPVELQYAGRQQEQAQAFRSLIIAALIASGIIFLLLSFQFNRLRQPLIIVISLPFTMIGVALGFIITGRVFDILAMIGVIMLIGIVVNNAIVLIDFVNKRRQHYQSPREAILSAAKARMRPIFTTTFTTVGGMIPMFIGGSYTSDFQTPVATALIFGLLFSTVVSLFILPMLYEILEGKAGKRYQGVTEEQSSL